MNNAPRPKDSRTSRHLADERHAVTSPLTVTQHWLYGPSLHIRISSLFGDVIKVLRWRNHAFDSHIWLGGPGRAVQCKPSATYPPYSKDSEHGDVIGRIRF